MLCAPVILGRNWENDCLIIPKSLFNLNELTQALKYYTHCCDSNRHSGDKVGIKQTCPMCNYDFSIVLNVRARTHTHTVIAKAEQRVVKQKARGGLAIFFVKPG